MSELRYGFEKILPDTTFEGAIEKVTAALKKEGFGILSEIDVKDTLRRKLDVDFRRYVILGACNPNLAHRALEAEPQIGLLLPCNVVVQESPDAGIVVSPVTLGAIEMGLHPPYVEPSPARCTCKSRTPRTCAAPHIASLPKPPTESPHRRPRPRRARAAPTK